MFEKQILKRFTKKIPAKDIPNLEGAISTGRDWMEYEYTLGIKPSTLDGKTVLNFGSGSSNIGKELKKEKINCNLIDLDIQFDPSVKPESINPFVVIIPTIIEIIYPLISSNKLKNKLTKIKQTISGTKGRKFIQGDGRALPFADKTFDYVLALWSTYQIPIQARETVFRELMRVSNILHIGPIFGNDYEIILKLVKELNYEIVVCLPDIPNFLSEKSYSQFMHDFTEQQRVQIPKQKEAIINITFRIPTAFNQGGNIIVLKRKSSN